MNTPITFPPAEPALRLARPSPEKWAATLAEERRRLNEDQEALREREQNLRDYEARLRVLQAEIEAGRSTAPASAPARTGTVVPFHRPSSQSPFMDDQGLQAAWEKMFRARELLEAEQRNLRDDRIALREFEAQIKQREEALAAREAKLAEREALVAAATPVAEAEVAEANHVSAMGRLTSAPFNIARSMFGGKK